MSLSANSSQKGRTILDLHRRQAHAPLSAIMIPGKEPGNASLGLDTRSRSASIRITKGSRVTALPLPRARNQLTAVSGPASRPREWDGMRAPNRF